MRRIGWFLVLMLVWGMGMGQQVLREVRDFGPNPGNLRLWVPSGVGRMAGAPLVIVMHGCTQSALEVAEQSGWLELASAYGIGLIFPEQKMSNNPSRCFNWFSEGDNRAGRGELGSIMSMRRWAVDSMGVDSGRCMVYGLSAGAFMGLSLLVQHPGSFVGGAVLGGGPYGQGDGALRALESFGRPRAQDPAVLAQRVRAACPDVRAFAPLVVVHGRADPVQHFGYAGQLVAQWSALMGGDSIADVREVAFQGVSALDRMAYLDSLGGVAVTLYALRGMGHALPVDPGGGQFQGGKTGRWARDVGFFSTYWIARDWGLVR